MRIRSGLLQSIELQLVTQRGPQVQSKLSQQVPQSCPQTASQGLKGSPYMLRLHGATCQQNPTYWLSYNLSRVEVQGSMHAPSLLHADSHSKCAGMPSTCSWQLKQARTL